jgi:amino acid transporter
VSDAPASADPKSQLRHVMGFLDVLLFNIASVLGPRWIAAAAHSGPSSISLWVISGAMFFVPSSLVIIELSTRFPLEGGLYAWTKEAFGEFHGFVAGWTYWVYTFFYFPGLLMSAAAMAAYVGGSGAAHLAQDRTFLIVGSLVILFVAMYLNLIGLNVGKWLQNAGGIATYAPLVMLVGMGAYVWHVHGSATQFTWATIRPTWNWNTVNFWPEIAFAYTGLELCSFMSEEVRDPRKTFPPAIVGSGILIALMYTVGTVALLALLPADAVDPKSGVFQALTLASTMLRFTAFGIVAAVLVTIGNAGGVGTTVAGVARIPFVVGIDRYMPAAFSKIHPKWKTPWVSIIVQAVISGFILLVTQLNESVNSAYQILIAAAVILYFIPFLYMFPAIIKLAYRPDRGADKSEVLVPGGKFGVWLVGLTGFLIVLAAVVLSMIPPGETRSVWIFEAKLIGGTGLSVAIGLILYARGAWQKAHDSRA